MTRIFKSRKAVSTVVVALIAFLLISTFTSALLYLATTQMQSTQTSTETTEKLSEKARESLQAWVASSSGGTIKIGVKNVGTQTSRVVAVLVKRPDGSLETIQLDPPVNVPPTSSDPYSSIYKDVTVNVAGSYSGLAVLTDLGNTFPIQSGTVVTQPTTYTVTFNVKDESGNTVSGATILFNGAAYSDGQTANVEAGSYTLSTGAIPSGYTFSQWEASGGVAVASPTASSTTATVSDSGSITMRLASAPQTATVTFSASGLSSDASGTVLTVDGSAYTYSQLPVSFTWAVGSTHSFAWSDPVSAGSGKQYTWVSTSGLSTARSGLINVPSGGGSVQATYKTQYQWIFSASGLGSDASGTVVTVDGTNYAYSSLPLTFWWDSGSPHSYSYQQYVSSTTSGKRYANHNPPSWSGTVSGSNSLNPSYHVEYQLTISVSPSGAGSTNPVPGSYWYDSGSSVQVSATPNRGYAFSYWLLDGSNVGSSNPYTVTMNTPHSITAVFTGATYTLTVCVYKSGTTTGISSVTVKVDGTPYTTGSTGAVSVTVSYGSHTVEVVSPYNPSYGTRYVFTQWSDGSTSNPKTVSISSSTTLTAYMKLQYLLSTSVNPSGGGSISASPSSSDWYYDEGTSVTLTASASSGYAFDAWTGDVSGTSNSVSVTMNSPKTVTANFFTFSISVSPSSGSASAGGSVSATVTVTYQSGVNSKTVSLSASGLPSGASASFNPASGTPTFSSTMTISTSSSTPAGTYTITIYARGAGVTRTTTYTLTVNVPFDFSISASPSTLSICRGASKTSTITVTLVSGSPTTVTLEALSWPDGLSLSLSRTSGTPTFTSTLTMTAPSSISLGTYTVYIQGEGGGKIKLTSINVYVNDWSISVSPSSGSVNMGGSTTATVTVQSTSGSASSMTVSLSASNVPSGVTVSFSPSSVTVGAGSSATSTVTVTVSSSASAGTYTIAITGSSDCGTSKSTSYTLIITVPTVAVTFDALKTSGARFNSNPTNLILYVDGNTYYYNQLPVTFNWQVGSQHYIYWYSGARADESSYLSGTDASYDWSYSTGIFTSQSGYLTVPSGGGRVTAYYKRYVEVIVDKEPYSGGTVSPPSSGWYPEGTGFSATANSGYQFHHWTIKDNSEWTSTGNPVYIRNPCYLTAVFYIRVRVYAYDSEYNSFPNIYVSCGPASGYTNSYGYVDLYVPYGYNTLSVSSSGSGYNGASLPFWKWSDGTTSTSRTIYVYQPTDYTAYYKCVLWFKEIHAETRCGPGTWFAVVYRTWGYVYVTTARSEYGKSGVTVKAVWHIHTEDLFGSHYFTRKATGTTGSGGYFDFSTSAYDYFLVWEDLWVEVSAQVTDPGYYNQAYWTARYPFS